MDKAYGGNLLLANLESLSLTGKCKLFVFVFITSIAILYCAKR